MKVNKSFIGAALAMSVVTSLAACSSTPGAPDNPDNGVAGEGVPYGSSIEEFRAAFEDVAPIVINTQSPAAPGSPVSQPYEDYFAYVEEYSGGKITFNVAFSNAIAGALDIDDAIRDGRLDLGNILPVYEPDQYPANAALADLSFVGNQAPAVAPLAAHGAFNEAAWKTPQLVEELESAGMHPLLPWYGDTAGILCTDPRPTKEDLSGLQIAASGKVNSLEIQSLGSIPVSTPYTELYEALQRGVIDCSLSSMRTVAVGGLVPVANHIMIDNEVGLGKTPGGLAINKEFWESLPLVAQQVLIDGTKVLLQTTLENAVAMQVAGFTDMLDSGGSVITFDDATRNALIAAHDQAFQDVAGSDNLQDGQALVDETLAAAESWESIVTGLGYPEDVTFVEFPDWYAKNGFDLTEYVETFFVETMLSRRPS